MIYLVFALIAAAAVLYLLYAGQSGNTAAAIAGENASAALLRERQTALKLSLRDIEYEFSVGKMEKADFERLQNEFLSEWESLEAKLAALPAEPVAVPPANSCPQCGTAIIAAARFCHACGAKLAQLLLAVVFLFSFVSGDSLLALDIRVSVRNSTQAKDHNAPLSVQLLKLAQGMQQVAAQTTAGGKTEFKSVPENAEGPYMVQAVYQGVTYSRVIPPNTPSPADVVLEIYESTASAAKVKVRTLVEVRRVEKDRLMGLMILYFVNRDNRTFTGGSAGLEFALPDNAQPEQASVSVGTGASNIQWLKVSPQKTGRAGIFAAGQNVKPGERILQVMFSMPYDDKGTALAFRSLYPQDTGLQLIAEPDDIQVEQNGVAQTRVKDPNLGRGLISFSAAATTVRLLLKGGGLAPVGKTEEAEAEVVVRSPLELWQKLLFPVVALLLFAAAFHLRSRKAA